MNNKSLKKYYNEELSKLREDSKLFAQKYPSIAPMLGEKSNDPDVERLLEGVAYLNAIIQKKIKDDFPELLNELLEILFPFYLKPIPSMSIIQFSADDSLKSKIDIKKETSVKATPYNNIKCEFQTVWEIEVSPMKLAEVVYRPINLNKSELIIKIDFTGNDFNQINSDCLDFYINDLKNNTSNILTSLLINFLEEIVVYDEKDNKICNFNKFNLINLGFDLEYSLLPIENNYLDNYSILQEFFIFEEKFRFFKLKGLSKLKGLINKDFCKFKFIFNKYYNEINFISNKSISLYCVPIINIFKDNSEPIKVKNLTTKFEITPSWKYREDYRIYKVIDVHSIAQGVKDLIKYTDFKEFRNNRDKKFLYKINREKSFSKKDSEVYYIEIFRKEENLVNEVLSIRIDITNGKIPEYLGLGDISIHTNITPARTIFKNIIVPTQMIDSPINTNNLWFLISHATTKILNIDNLEKLKEYLSYYIYENNRNKTKVEINKRKINSLIQFKIMPSSYIYKGTLLRGSKIEIVINSEKFFNIGEMHIFLNLIHFFFSINSTINTYVELEAYDNFTGEMFSCKPKIGLIKNI